MTTKRLKPSSESTPLSIATDAPWQPSTELSAMMKRAKQKSLWFFCSYQELWFSPAELERAWAEGRFRWEAINWQLRQPSEHLAELSRAAQKAEHNAQEFAARLTRAIA